jgi:hypothetical protein
MKTTLIFASLLALACFGFAGTANADSTTAGGVVYTFTAGEADPGGVFDVIMTVDTTGATASGTLSSFAVQFTGATNVSFESVSANAGSWSAIIQGNNGGNTCTLNVNTNFWCSTGNIAITSGGPGDVYTFEFDVTMPNGTPLPTGTHIQALQGEGALAISNDVGIGPPPSVPEPASLTLLGLGLAGIPFLRRKRS